MIIIRSNVTIINININYKLIVINKYFYKQEELEILKTKVERLEQERNHLKHDNDRLEAKVHAFFPRYFLISE